MAIPAKCARIVMFGRLFGIQDWSTGHWVQYDAASTTPSSAELQSYLSTLWAQANALYKVFRPNNFTGSFVDGLRAYYYDGSGNTAVAQADYAPSGGSPGLATKRQPPLLSMVTSLQTGRPGRSYRGRMYWPITGAPDFTANGEMPSTNIDSHNTALSLYFGQLNDLTASGTWFSSNTAVVVSQTRGIATPIVSIETNSVIDTQHRRSNDFTPGYVKETVIP